MRNIAEELGKSQTGKEEESLTGTEIEEGQTERDLDLIDRAKVPKLKEKEWSRLETCDGAMFKRGVAINDEQHEVEDDVEFRTLEWEKGGRITNRKRRN